MAKSTSKIGQTAKKQTGKTTAAAPKTAKGKTSKKK
ncbi:hypothetical protein Pan153_15240 [Gimesia panareensis]|jgi:hypothetical protein|uniref:Uncharacterized protein n=2 Tax=Gimesia TaxID=1649453 RepID=A0A517PMB1_9PLAN|nr:hypothetical protein HG66A1_23080 [Gimesia chilikensis]QDT27317.1 hypothetical protein Enr10x_26340 [Gimesia panareensis]QDT85087.1 hypothetical protein MalM14_27540 [Gimesia chilikensis]QDU02639.1 hypothetical protein V6x_23440 [Gimesia chilikensis]QDV16890.1 hypothetical protein Pan153_15240 [Gimesia panareensis]